MTYKEVATMVSGFGLPYAYYQFKETQQGPPFACFFFSGDNDLKADDSNYQKIEHLIIEIYTETKDYDLESTVETQLAQSGMVWSKAEEWLDSERMMMVVYEMDVVITPPTTEENNVEQD